MTRTPFKGLKILEELYKKQPNNQWLVNSLIHAYIKLGHHDIALRMIADIPNCKSNVQSLIFQSWSCHQQDDIATEQKNWEKIFDKNYYDATHGILGNLMYRGTHEVVLKEESIPLFCTERNEMLRLPFFLEHYRNLGVTDFFFVDNNSDDGSFEFLIKQPDCHVFWTSDSYQQAGCGMVWLQYLIEQYVYEDQWYLIIDADEFLVYPSYETKKLDVLIQYLNVCDANAIHSFMLDMFPKNIERQLAIDPFTNLIDQSPYFYNNYEFNYQSEPPYIKPRGGIFYVLDHLKCLTVVPLFKKTTPMIKSLYSRHATTPIKLPSLTSCLLHFKFLGDFADHALNEMKRKEHWSGGREYRQYFQMFERNIDEKFQFTNLPKTTKYQNSQQLVDLGLIQCSQEWTGFVNKAVNDD